MPAYAPLPVGAIVRYKGTKTVELLRPGLPGPGPKQKGGKKQKIKYLSQKSLNRFLFLTQISTIQMISMLTITYLCPPVNGGQAKRDLRCVLTWLKRHFEGGQGGVDYIWFAEFQRRGAIHFHVLLSQPVTHDDRLAYAAYWSKKNGKRLGRYCPLRTGGERDPIEAIYAVASHPRTWEMIHTKDGAKRYIAKYVSKDTQKEVPTWFSDIGRYWGVSARVRASRKVESVEAIDEDEVRELLIRQRHRLAGAEVLPRYVWGFEG